MKEKVDAFFGQLKQELRKVKFDLKKVYNVNEIGISIV
jgi:hypothetical protein